MTASRSASDIDESPRTKEEKIEKNSAPLPPPLLNSQEYMELQAKYAAVTHEINAIKIQLDRPWTPGQMFAIGSVSITGVAIVSIFSNWAWKKAFPGMPEERTRTPSTQME